MADHHNKYNNNNKVINIARIIKIWHRICYQSLSLATAFLPWSFHLLYITSIFPFHSFSSYGYICCQVSKCCWKNGANILACHGVAINFQFVKKKKTTPSARCNKVKANKTRSTCISLLQLRG